MEGTDTTATNVGISGSPPSFAGNSKGETLPSGKSTGKGGQSDSSAPQFGISLGLDETSASHNAMFVDINGDGLADSCQKSGSGIDCRISTGYEFTGTLHFDNVGM